MSSKKNGNEERLTLDRLRQALRRHDLADSPPKEGVSAGLGLMILLGCPLGHWLGTPDASLIGGLLTGLLIGLGLFAATAVISTIGDAMLGKGRSDRYTLAMLVLLSPLLWFSIYEPLWVPAAMSAALPAVAFYSAWRARQSGITRRRDALYGLSDEALAAVRALPAELPAELQAMIDRALADLEALDRYARQGFFAQAGIEAAVVRADVDRTLLAIVQRTQVAAELRERGEAKLIAKARTIEQGVRALVKDMDGFAEAVLLAAAGEDQRPLDSLRERAEHLRLTAAGLAELERELGG